MPGATNGWSRKALWGTLFASGVSAAGWFGATLTELGRGQERLETSLGYVETRLARIESLVQVGALPGAVAGDIALQRQIDGLDRRLSTVESLRLGGGGR